MSEYLLKAAADLEPGRDCIDIPEAGGRWRVESVTKPLDGVVGIQYFYDLRINEFSGELLYHGEGISLFGAAEMVKAHKEEMP